MRYIIVILALLNIMIGNNFVEFPALTVQPGPLLSTLVLLLTGFLNFYSCYLYLEHLGNHQDMDDAIQYHFWDSKIVKGIYNGVTFIFFLVYMSAIYEATVDSWDFFFPNQNSLLNPIFNAIGIFGLVCVLKYCKLTTQFLAFGSIFTFFSCFLLIWVLADAPPGNNHPPVIGTGTPIIIIAGQTLFEIQQFFVPILRYLPKEQIAFVKKYVTITYIIGGILYLFMAYVGCFGLINREVINPPALTLYSYYQLDLWQAQLLRALVLLTYYFTFGEIMVLAKNKIFRIINSFYQIKCTNYNQFFTIQQMIFVSLLMGLFLGLQLGNVTVFNIFIPFMVVLTYIYVYMVPAILQFKCLYFARPKTVYNVVYESKNFEKQDPHLSLDKPGQKMQEKIQTKRSTIREVIEKIRRSRKYTNKSTFQIQQISLKEKSDLDSSLKDQKQIHQFLTKQKKKAISIQTLNEVCPAQLPIGRRRIFDLCCIFAMLGLGMYVTIENIINPLPY